MDDFEIEECEEVNIVAESIGVTNICMKNVENYGTARRCFRQGELQLFEAFDFDLIDLLNRWSIRSLPIRRRKLSHL
jgi:hypothetical protein